LAQDEHLFLDKTKAKLNWEGGLMVRLIKKTYKL
jgi:hypothetical protein